MRYDMPTNEGSLALARSVATGAKIAIRGAALCSTESYFTDVASVASCTWADIAEYASMTGLLPCTGYLPSMVYTNGGDTGTAMAALDIEFSYLPDEAVTYDTIAVLADVYYAFSPFVRGRDYSVGATTSYLNNDGTYSYYRCIRAVTNSDIPANDSISWESVTPAGQLDEARSGGLQYYAITETPILLYVSKINSAITLSDHIEVNYKVRLYLEGVTSTTITDYVVFDTLGPEFSGTAQIALLAEITTLLKHVRDVALGKA